MFIAIKLEDEPFLLALKHLGSILLNLSKTTKYFWEKLKKAQINPQIYHVYRLEDSILRFPNRTIYSMQFQ